MTPLVRKLRVALGAIKRISNWPVFFVDYVKLIKNKHVTYVFKSGLKIMLRAGTTDRNIVSEVLILDCYLKVNEGDIVVDVGAHIGAFCILAARVAKKVYAFEPAPENFKLLKQNIAVNNLNNVVAFEGAVAMQTGSGELFLRPDDPCANSMVVKTGTKTTIKTISLPDLMQQNSLQKIDYLKLDCEGSEYEILYNCPKEILAKIGSIALECHYVDQEKNIGKLMDFLKSCGFIVEISPKSDNIMYAHRHI